MPCAARCRAKGILAFDVGAHTHQIASQWTAHAPKTFQITNGWSSMGFGLPAAIAAKLARPDLPVVCLIGDGCFQMTCGEVAVAKRLSLALPIVVLDDRWLALIKVKQIRRQIPLYGTELQTEEYRDPPAHYFGVPAIGVRDAAALEAAVAKALRAERPDRDRGGRRFRALHRHGLRLRTARDGTFRPFSDRGGDGLPGHAFALAKNPQLLVFEIRHCRLLSAACDRARNSRHGIARVGAARFCRLQPDDPAQGGGAHDYGSISIRQRAASERSTVSRLPATARSTGYNTDAFGFYESVREAQPEWRAVAGPVVVIGAGGAARAVLASLADRGAREIRLVNRTAERAQAMAQEFGDPVAALAWRERNAALAGAAMLVNTTNQGMEGMPPLDIALDELPISALVVDIIYIPRETPLLAAARRRGNRIVNGLGMLLHQARPAFHAWCGIMPDVTTELRAMVEATT